VFSEIDKYDLDTATDRFSVAVTVASRPTPSTRNRSAGKQTYRSWWHGRQVRGGWLFPRAKLSRPYSPVLSRLSSFTHSHHHHHHHHRRRRRRRRRCLLVKRLAITCPLTVFIITVFITVCGGNRLRTYCLSGVCYVIARKNIVKWKFRL